MFSGIMPSTRKEDASIPPANTQKRGSVTGGVQRTRSASFESSMIRSASMIDSATKDAAKAKRQAKFMGYFAITMGLFLAVSALANFAIIYYVVDEQVQTETSDTDNLVSKAHPDSIVRTAEAEEDMPLVVAPVLPFDALDRVKTLTVRFTANYDLFIRAAEPDLQGDVMITGSRDPSGAQLTGETPVHTPGAVQNPTGENATDIDVKYHIVGYAHLSNTSMTFFADRGDKIIIEDGAAWIERPRGHVYYVSFSSAHAAAFKVAGINATEYEVVAFRALEERGLTDDARQMLTFASPNARRQLSESHEFVKEYRRKLLVDYGWCSGSALFIAGIAGDSSNFCSSQNCDSWAGGCDMDLSDCCITHDRCLQADTRAGPCAATNCKGKTCDTHLAGCASTKRCQYRSTCCGWRGCGGCWRTSGTCVAVREAIKVGFGMSSSPQSSWNTGGANTHACCNRADNGQC
jgi:hypothetical protein